MPDLHMLLIPLVLLSGLEQVAMGAQIISKVGCQEKCGNVSVPYPFGIGDSCSIDAQFNLTCNHSFSPPKLFLPHGNLVVLDISPYGELRTLVWNAWDCYDEYGNRFNFTAWTTLARFTFSDTRNKFTAIGCDTVAYIIGTKGQTYTSGCISLCSDITHVVNGSCAGMGCCQTSIPKGLMKYEVEVYSFDKHSKVWKFNPCSYAFLTEEGLYNFSSTDLQTVTTATQSRVVLDWAVGNETCEEAKRNLTTYACHENSYCYSSKNGRPGYLCNCSDGYQGNPYLPQGCQDIDECSDPSLIACSYQCNNTIGGYFCSCPSGYHGDGRINGQGCLPDINDDENDRLLVIKFTLGACLGIFFLLACGCLLYCTIRKRRIILLKEQNFQKNGGLLLDQIASRRGVPAEIFKEEYLKRATENFDENHVIGEGGFGMVYRGVLHDNRVVAIKKPKIMDQSQISQFVNEIHILLQISHPNVVKLLGCCLETEVPLLVYEFISNGTLFQHIHREQNRPFISWENRLRIATETAGALAHLHSHSIPVLHRDMKSANILLDNNHIAKVSDFGASRFVPSDQTQMTALVQGTFGYLDPECLHTGQLTDKSDVYSFGIVLVELLTGEKPLSLDRPEVHKSLAMYFISSLRENRLFQILENGIVNETNNAQVRAVAELARKCLKVKGEDRPTMKEVEDELIRLGNFQELPRVVQQNYEETEPLLDETSNYSI